MMNVCDRYKLSDITHINQCENINKVCSEFMLILPDHTYFETHAISCTVSFCHFTLSEFVYVVLGDTNNWVYTSILVTPWQS